MIHSPLQEEVDRQDSAIVAVAVMVANSQDSSFPSQESEAAKTSVRSSQSPEQQEAMRQDRKSGSMPS